MPKQAKTSKPTTQIVEGRSPNVRGFDFDAADAAAAAQLGLVMEGAIENRLARAAMAYNQAARLTVEAGYLLLSIKTNLPRGEFEDRVESLGLSSQRASELMRMAKFVTSLPETQRLDMLTLPKTKVLALASADAEVIEELLEVGSDEIDGLSVRELRQRIRELEANLTDTNTQRDTAEANLEAVEQKLKRGLQPRADQMPHAVADLRAEITALAKKAELAIESFTGIANDLMPLIGSASHLWADGTLRLANAALASVRSQLEGAQRYLASALPEGEAENLIYTYLTQQEAAEVVEHYATLVSTHSHEKAYRAQQREAGRPKGRGRPKALIAKPGEGV